jgi:hypothetical protein
MTTDERPSSAGRRSGKDRRSGVDTRSDEERRLNGERRADNDRRSGSDQKARAGLTYRQRPAVEASILPKPSAWPRALPTSLLVFVVAAGRRDCSPSA